MRMWKVPFFTELLPFRKDVQACEYNCSLKPIVVGAIDMLDNMGFYRSHPFHFYRRVKMWGEGADKRVVQFPHFLCICCLGSLSQLVLHT